MTDAMARRDPLQDKTAIVTGAGSGLGAATALALARRGVRVAAADVSPTRLDETGAKLRATANGDSGRHLLLPLDVSDARQVEAAVARVAGAFGRIDFLVNCAGIDYTLSLTDLSVEQFDRVLAVNLRGPFLLARQVFPIMRANGGGHIVNVASTAAIRTWANASAYTASKFGLVGFTRAIGVEGRPYNIRATSLLPGGMATSFFDRPDLEVKPDPARLNDPANVAETIVFLVSQPDGSVIQEMLVTPLDETSWP